MDLATHQILQQHIIRKNYRIPSFVIYVLDDLQLWFAGQSPNMRLWILLKSALIALCLKILKVVTEFKTINFVERNQRLQLFDSRTIHS